MSERETGRVKWFNEAKGYGFVERSKGGDVFVHFSSVRGTGFKKLTEGQNVDFVVGQGEKGPEALDVGPAAAEIPQRLRELNAANAVASATTTAKAPVEIEAGAGTEAKSDVEEGSPTVTAMAESSIASEEEHVGPTVAEASGQQEDEVADSSALRAAADVSESSADSEDEEKTLVAAEASPGAEAGLSDPERKVDAE